MSLTLEAYAAAKRLDVSFLRRLGITELFNTKGPYLRVPYKDESGIEQAIRFRHELSGPNRFRWRLRSKPMLYGLDRLRDARARGFVLIVEGESDCHTLWQADLPAVGVPGATSWKEGRDAPSFDGFDPIYIVREPDDAGTKLVELLSRSSIAPRVRVITFAQHKDVSEAYLAGPDDFAELIHQAMAAAIPLEQIQSEAAAKATSQDYELCHALAAKPRILDEFAKSSRNLGVVGEDRNAKIIFLALTSRLFDKPVNVVVKGPSSAGKSFVAGHVLQHFPDEAYIFRTTFSEHALIYTDEPFSHRFLVIAEASGAEGNKQEYLVRTLLSEGRIEYETVEKIGGVMTPRRITKDGPTGLIVTTTRALLHPENETRLLSLTVSDTREQTQAVIQAIAADHRSSGAVEQHWPALQRWLATGETRVVVPFASALANLVNPAATRVRRDFTTLLSLIKAHALLHRERRERDPGGSILATLEDYGIVHDLVADLFAHGVAKTVKPTVRETVEAVRHLSAVSAEGPVTNQAIARHLRIDAGAASRRCHEALTPGYITNEQERKGRPANYKLGTPMPDDEAVLPSAAELEDAMAKGDGGAEPLAQEINRSTGSEQPSPNGCAIDGLFEGIDTPLPPSPNVDVVEEVI